MEQEVRISLLQYYSSGTLAHGGYLIAFSLGVVSIIQLIPLLIPFFQSLPLPLPFILPVIIFCLIISIGVHLVGRTFFWGKLANTILSAEPFDPEKLRRVHGEITPLLLFHWGASEFIRKHYPKTFKFHSLSGILKYYVVFLTLAIITSIVYLFFNIFLC